MARILAADDDPMIREILKLMLQKLGHEVTIVIDGFKAKEALESGNTFDCLISDRMMPGLDGIRLIEWIRSSSTLSSLPCILLSADDASNISVQAKVLQKPFSPSDLSDAIASIL